jgi:flavin-dependent dehydrogenase
VEVKTDVAIIGAGPAGSTLAALLASRGVDVALVDRDVFPRDKLCGEFLSYDALPVLEPLGIVDEIDRTGAPRIERCRIVARHAAYDFAFPRAARGISRLTLDHLLLKAAASRGATVFEGWTAASVHPTITNAAGDVIRARILVGAWGRWGRFDAQLARGFVRDREHRSFGFKRHYRPKTPADPSVIDLYSFQQGYLGVSPVESGVTNICGLVHAQRLTGHKGRWETFVDTIRAEEQRLETLFAVHQPAQDDFLSSEPVIFRGRTVVEKGIFMIGDASGILDPLSGNGMAMAVQSALVAAPHLVQLLERPADRSSIEQRYQHDHEEMFASRIRWSRRVARVLSRPAILDAALRLHPPSRVGEFLLSRTRAAHETLSRRVAAWF